LSLSIGVVARRPRRSGDLDIEGPAADGDRRRRCNRSTRNGWCPRCRSTSERRRTEVSFAGCRTNRPDTRAGGEIAWKAVVGREWLNGQGRAGKRRLGAEGGSRAGAQQRGAAARALQSTFMDPQANQSAPSAPIGVATRPKSSARRRTGNPNWLTMQADSLTMTRSTHCKFVSYAAETASFMDSGTSPLLAQPPSSSSHARRISATSHSRNRFTLGTIRRSLGKTSQ